MGSRALVVVSLLVLGGCYPGKLVQGLELTCNPGIGQLCPPGHTCSAFGRCSSDEALFTDATVDPNPARDGVTVTARFVAENLDRVPTVTVADDRGRTLGVFTYVPEAEPPPAHVFTWVVTADAGFEGDALVLADLTRAGAVSLAHKVTDKLALDFHPPNVTSNVTLIPASGSPLPQITELGANATLSVLALADEDLGGASTVRLRPCAGGAASLTLSVDAGPVRSVTLAGPLPSAPTPTQGCHGAELELHDLAGNTSVVDAGQVTVDTLPPAEPSLEPGRIVYRREATPTAWRLSLRVDGGVGPFETLVVTLPGAGTVPLARQPADATGSIAELVIDEASPEDVKMLAVAAADRAGNASSRRRVRDVEWVGLGGRSPELLVLPRPADTAAPHQANERAALAPGPQQLLQLTAQPSWRLVHTDQQDLTAPGVDAAAVACDEERRECLLFGGSFGNNKISQATWRFNGTSWAQVRALQRQPPARTDSAMAYDAHRGVYVMVGGFSAVGDLRDVWEFSGGEWFERTDAPFEHQVSQHAMTYDLARRRVQLTGGATAPMGGTAMWEFDGETWVKGASAPPPARFRHTMVYDRARNRTLVLGGTGQPASLAIYEPASGWRAGPPAAVDGGAGTVYDPVSQQLLAFRRGACLAFSSATDIWGASGWSCSSLPPEPWAMVFAEPEGVVVHQLALAGGVATWLFSRDGGAGSAPRPIATQGFNPVPRWRHTLTMLDGGVALVGGSTGSGSRFTALHALTDTGWLAAPASLTLPYGVDGHATVVVNRRPVVVGGNDGGSSGGSALFLEPGGWEARNPVPAFVEGHVAGVSPAGIVVFGGGRASGTGFTPQLGTWRFNGSAWQDLTPSLPVSPSPRYDAAMVTLADGGLLMFGGQAASGSALDETWLFTDAWLAQPLAPGLQRFGHAMTVDGEGKVIVFGGVSQFNAFDDTLQRADDGTWRRLPLADPEGDGVPARRIDHAMALRPGGGVVLFGGGLSEVELYSDTWELDRHEAAAELRLSLEDVGLSFRDGAVPVLSDLTFTAVAGAGASGASVSLWHDGAFDERRRDPAASFTSPAPIAFELHAADGPSSAGVLERLALRGEIVVIVRPVERYPARTDVSLGRTDVLMRFRYPASPPLQ